MLSSIRLPWPVDWAAQFDRAAPLVVEIGFGNGQFLLEMARQRPLLNFVGLEISLPSLRKATRKAQRDGLGNVRLVQGGAMTFFWTLCSLQAVSEVYINFPDPWPKAGHHHRRLIDEQFLHLLATRMRPGALLEIATDHVEYAQAILDCLQATPFFDSRFAEPLLMEDNGRIRTKYEMKALTVGQPCHYFKWQRNDVAATNIFPIPQELSMPHVVMRSPLSLDEVAQQFVPFHVATETTEIKFIELFRSTRHQNLLFETYIHEEPMSQRLGLSLRVRQPGDWVLGLHEVGFPRPTAGLHRAVQALADWLASLHPETQIINSTLVD
ncbi:MAG: tRNA (guanosine(46)-N7)-methyltransferase TrmB [Chloroflexota bacterium]